MCIPQYKPFSNKMFILFICMKSYKMKTDENSVIIDVADMLVNTNY